MPTSWTSPPSLQTTHPFAKSTEQCLAYDHHGVICYRSRNHSGHHANAEVGHVWEDMPPSPTGEDWGKTETRVTDPEGEPFAVAVRKIYQEACDLLLKKHQDYGPKNISQSPGGPLNGLRVRMWDKTARINNLIDTGAAPENESLADSFIDLLNYSAIALLVLRGEWPAE